MTLRWSSGANNLPGAGAAELGPVQGEGEAGGGGALQGEAGGALQGETGGAGCGEEEEHEQRPQWEEGYLPTLLPQGSGKEVCLPTLSHQSKQSLAKSILSHLK